MSMYGPPGGPYPGQPQDPWQGGPSPDDPYGPPPGPYGGLPQQDPWGDASPAHYGAYADPAAGMPPPGDVWGPAQAPPRRGSSGLVVGVVALLALVLLGGIGVGVYVYTRDSGDDATGGPGPSTSAPASAPPASSAPPTASPSGSPPGPSQDAKTAKPGDCLANRGTDAKPDMRKVPCAPNTYQVLKRINGTADRSRCDGTPNLTDWYFYDHPDDASDFVLCLRKR
jgi:hypothetical protein